jgi:hypothetical protein
MDAQRHNERLKSEIIDQLDNENYNQGLINTIVNHNSKIKNIENKFNYVVNNFANSNHVEEMIE